MPKVNSLTPKQRRFVDEYLVDFNGSQAAIRAGYSEKTARSIASENLTKDYVRNAIGERIRELSLIAERGTQRLAEQFANQEVLRRAQVDRRQGVIYLLQADNGLVKIGITTNFIRRYAMLNSQLPYDLTVLLVIDCNDCVRQEQELHQRFADKRIKGEWFSLSEQDIKWVEAKYGTVS